MGGLLGLIYLIAVIVGIVDVLKGAFDTGKKILWIALIVLIPYVGVILYFVIGKKK